MVLEKSETNINGSWVTLLKKELIPSIKSFQLSPTGGLKMQ